MTPMICPDPTVSSATVSLDSCPMEGLRLRRVERNAVIRIPARLEDLLAPDHMARLVWGVVKQLNLTAFYKEIAVTVDSPGRPAIDPLILCALWVYALSQGVMEARELGRLCVEHLAYIWLCGGVSVNYHTFTVIKLASRFVADWESFGLDSLYTRVGTTWSDGFNGFDHELPESLQ